MATKTHTTQLTLTPEQADNLGYLYDAYKEALTCSALEVTLAGYLRWSTEIDDEYLDDGGLVLTIRATVNTEDCLFDDEGDD